jgi:hypothetical protein
MKFIFTALFITLLNLLANNTLTLSQSQPIARIIEIKPSNNTSVTLERLGKRTKVSVGQKLYNRDLLKIPRDIRVRLSCTYINQLKSLPHNLTSSVSDFCPTVSPPPKLPIPPKCIPALCPKQSPNDYRRYFQWLQWKNEQTANLPKLREELQQIIKEGSQLPFVYRYLGEVHEKLSEFKQAEQLYLKAIQLAQVSGDKEELNIAKVKLNELDKRLQENKNL